MDKRYAIFDMDGTLVDSMGYWRDLEREFLVRKGITEGLDEILEVTKPMTIQESSTLFVERYQVEGTPEQLAAEMNDIMEEHYRTDICLKPGAAEYLAKLREQGVTMCVASATGKPLVKLCLERLGLDQYFRFILSCVEVGAGKSRPDVFLEAARRLGSSPADTAVFEDAIYAVRAAHSAGFHVVAVKDAHNDGSWEEMTALADEVILDWTKTV